MRSRCPARSSFAPRRAQDSEAPGAFDPRPPGRGALRGSRNPRPGVETGSARRPAFRLQHRGARWAAPGRGTHGAVRPRAHLSVPLSFIFSSPSSPRLEARAGPRGGTRPVGFTRPQIRPRRAWCAERSLSLGGPTLPRVRPAPGPGEVAWSRAPEARADFPLFPRGLPTPYRSRNQ